MGDNTVLRTRALEVPEVVFLTGEPRVPARRRLLKGWPLRLMIAGYVLTWLVGLGEFVFPLVAVVMGVSLIRRRKVLVPPRFGWWLGFVGWVLLASIMSLQDAPGTMPGSKSVHFLSWALRFVQYVSVGITLLYIGNVDERALPTKTIVRSMGWLFIITVFGGYLGMLLPHLELATPLELVLPRGISKVGQVNEAVHLQVAQVQDFLGYSQARPDAPFPYTNVWGANLGLLIPMFVAGFLTKMASQRCRVVGVVILALAVPPIINSVNRGLWIALIAAAVYVILRLALLGRTRIVGRLLVAITAGALLIAISPLYGTIQDRLAHPHSDARRADLAQTAIRVGLKSPVLGWGTTRDAIGNNRSIALGQTATCKTCGIPPIGTHGQFYLLVFTTGVVGVALYLLFLLRSMAAYWPLTDPVSLAAHTMVAVGIIEMFFYELVGSPQAYLFVALGILWRADIKRQREGTVVAGRNSPSVLRLQAPRPANTLVSAEES